MRLYLLSFALGVWLLQRQPELPSIAWLWALPLLATPLFFVLVQSGTRTVHKIPPNPVRLRVRQLVLALSCLALGFAWAAWRAETRMADVLPTAWQGVDIQLEGVVAGLPERDTRGEHFDFRVENTLTPSAVVPRHIRLSWPAPQWNSASVPQRLKAGDRWRLTVRLKQPHGTANPDGFDYEAWLLTHSIRATGTVRDQAQRLNSSTRPDDRVQRLRDDMRTAILQTLGTHAQAGVIAALAVGDQSAIPHDNWRTYNRTGTSHLMSISGLHITLFAVLAGAVMYVLWRRIPLLVLKLPARRAALLAGWLAALAYTVLAGFQIPAQRTLFMLTVLVLGLWLQRAPRPFSLLTLALFVVLLIDPWAVLAAGFWLSFGAVAGMMLAVQGLQGGHHKLSAWMRAQAAVTLALVPVLLLLFHQISLISPLANALAIPVVSWGVVPMTLLGLMFDSALHAAAWLMQWVEHALRWLSDFSWASWALPTSSAFAILLGLIGVSWLLMPGLPVRGLGVFMLLPMLFPHVESPVERTFEAEVLDVGQGTSVLIRTANHTLLYDTGPALGDNDAGQQIVLPRLRALGVEKLDGLILTHDDSDHTGGAASVLRDVDAGWLLSSLPYKHDLLQRPNLHCVRGQHWNWDGIRFEILNPTAAAYQQATRKDNDRSCVLKISQGKTSLLLTADAERIGELEMTERLAEKLPSTVLMAGHHGSLTSSIPEFVDLVDAQQVVFSSGWHNRFGHPHSDVLARFRDRKTRVFRTDKQGWVRMVFSDAGVETKTWRRTHIRYWQQVE